MTEPLLTPREAALQLGCSPKSIYAWVAAGRMKAVRLGRAIRVAPAEVERVRREGIPRPLSAA